MSLDASRLARTAANAGALVEIKTFSHGNPLADGTIQHDDEACIGCQSCVKACPYGTPQFRDDLKIVQKCSPAVPMPTHTDPVREFTAPAASTPFSSN